MLQNIMKWNRVFMILNLKNTGQFFNASLTETCVFHCTSPNPQSSLKADTGMPGVVKNM